MSAGSAPNGPSWTSYHGGASAGVAAGVVSVDTARRAWTSRALDGQLYGQPVVAGGDVIVATEHDTVYALSARTGAVMWSRHLGAPVPASALACGNISPWVGVTGTPVVDPSRHEVFLVADVFVAGHPRHRLVGLDTATGAVRLSVGVDPPGSDPSATLQRTGLVLDAGRVVFGEGGNYGDCGAYRGRVVAVGENGTRPLYFTLDAAPGEREGAVWMGGAAPVVDTGHHVWVSVGNGSVTSSQGPYDHSDAVAELSSTMRLLAYFAPSSWASDNASDADLSMAPALLADGQVVVSGKSRVAYLLDGGHLGGVGGDVANVPNVCGGDVDGAAVVLGTLVILPCTVGPVALRVGASPTSLTVLWSATVGGGPPAVAGGLVWSIGSDGTLDGVDLATGALVRHASLGAQANHFPTPGFGDGLLLASTATRVVALRVTAR